MNDKEGDEEPAENCLVVLPLLPSVVVAVDERERDSRRGDKWREIHKLKHDNEPAFSCLNGDVGEDGAQNARE